MFQLAGLALQAETLGLTAGGCKPNSNNTSGPVLCAVHAGQRICGVVLLFPLYTKEHS